MSEATPQKRVLPARERTESSAKKQAASPTTPTTPTELPRQKRKYTKRASLLKPPTPITGTSTRSTSVEESLPTRIHVSKSLPTAAQKQNEKLSNKEYQSIAESAVLAASLHRSRMQWLCEGVFKRYWTKPVKRKGVIEQPPGNPDVKSMSKLGNATMTIEPHVFDVTFYTVKDPTVAPAPQYRHPNQHTVNKPPPNPPPHASARPSENAATISSGPSNTPTPAPTLPTGGSVTHNKPIKQEPLDNTTKSNAPTSSTPTITHPPHPVAHPPTQSVAPAPPSRPANDPVIQMLAARAATDNRLKELMKVVATSQASSEQLKEFQAHIDEFNRIIKLQEARKVESEKAKQAAPPAAAHPASYGGPSRPHPGPPTSIGGPMHMAPPSYMPYPPPRPEPFIKHVIVEFHSTASASQSASTDRWLFPEYAILDIKPGGMEMVASFFVVRRGEDVLKSYFQGEDGNGSMHHNFKPDVEYFQPVTIHIKATQHKTIETIARAAKSLPECQSHMKEVMEKKTRAPQEYLIHRLPRDRVPTDISGADFVDSAVELSNDEDDELKDVYGTCM